MWDISGGANPDTDTGVNAQMLRNYQRNRVQGAKNAGEVDVAREDPERQARYNQLMKILQGLGLGNIGSRLGGQSGSQFGSIAGGIGSTPIQLPPRV